MKNMKLNNRILLLILVIFVPYIYSAFQYVDPSARTNGLSGAFVGLADDLSSIVYNPAGLRQLLVKTVSLSYLSIYTGLPDISLGLFNLSYAHPVENIGCFGFYFLNYNAAGVYNENLISLTYSSKLNDFLEDLQTEIYTGINLKFLFHSYNWDEETKNLANFLNDPVITKSNSPSGFSLDIGSIIRLGKIVYWGFSYSNLIPVNLGIYYEDIVPSQLKTGLSFRKPIEDNDVLEKLNINCDISYRMQDWGNLSDRLNLHTAAEIYFKQIDIVTRAGINLDSFSLGVSYHRNLSQTKNMELTLHYSFSIPFRISDNYGSHNITLVYGFGKPISEKKKEVIEEKIKVKEELLEEIFKEEKEQPKQELKKELLQPTTAQIIQEPLQQQTTQQIQQEVKPQQEIKPQDTIQQSEKQELQQGTTQQMQQQPTKKDKKQKSKEKAEENIDDEIMKKLLELEKEGGNQ